jgi:pimeloyl-ACP methyl ester carboxylesterase
MVGTSQFQGESQTSRLRSDEPGRGSRGWRALGRLADDPSPDARAVVLLHGWPYDIHTFAEVSPLLAAAGSRVIVPYLRGYGTTRFLSDETFRNGQQSVLAVDAAALMDALGIEKAVVAGADWGARTADIVAALWPERCAGLVSVSGYLIGSQQAGELPLAPEAERQWWYQYYFATERGRAGYERYWREFARLIWRTASPQWDFDDATFERSAASLDNPRSRGDRDPQLPLADWRGRQRAAVRHAGAPPGRGARHQRADDHPRRRRQRRAASGPQRLRGEVRGPALAPDHHRRSIVGSRAWRAPLLALRGTLDSTIRLCRRTGRGQWRRKRRCRREAALSPTVRNTLTIVPA